jgi:hypothetical protein
MRYIIIGLERRLFLFWKWRWGMVAVTDDYDFALKVLRLLSKHQPYRQARLYEQRFSGVCTGDK